MTHIQQILPDELVEYFKHVANEIKENKDHIVSSIQELTGRISSPSWTGCSQSWIFEAGS